MKVAGLWYAATNAAKSGRASWWWTKRELVTLAHPEKNSTNDPSIFHVLGEHVAEIQVYGYLEHPSRFFN
jgi:hypothetical protein